MKKIVGHNEGQVFGQNAYATEGWCVSNRGWQASVTFATAGSQQIKLFDADYKKEITQAKSAQTITIELKAALNQDWGKTENGWVTISDGVNPVLKVNVVETENNSGIFTARFNVPAIGKVKSVNVTYGYLVFETSAQFTITSN